MDTKSWHLYDAYDIGIESGNITFWTAMIHEIIPPHRGDEVILDYGCGSGQFLRLLHQMRPFAHGVGVDVDQALLSEAQGSVRDGEPIQFSKPDILDELDQHFDFIFSQEVFWMIQDLSDLAAKLYRAIKDKGEYYATMGCHIENPLWPHRRRLLQSEGEKVYDYSLDEVADIFHHAGFEVGLKRLPVEYFNLYHPDFTPRRAQSLSRLVDSTYDHKMLFYFRRDDEWRKETSAKHPT